MQAKAFEIEPVYIFFEVRHGSGLHHADGATAEAAAGHACAVNAFDAECRIDQEIEFVATDFVIVLQAAVGGFE